jgi:hypothetical protein
MAKELADIPNGLRKVHRRFQHWRNKHAGSRLPIPGRLWRAATAAAQEHGVCRTAQVLRLEYGKLKRLAESGKAGVKIPAKKVRGTQSDAPSFLELVGSPAIGVSECVIDLEGSQGKMRIQWKGTASPDLAGLSRALWERS